MMTALILTRQDLVGNMKGKTLDNISGADFRVESFAEIPKHSVVIFVDDLGDYRILKDRHEIFNGSLGDS